MKAIWKYPLGIQSLQTLIMPEGAKPLSVQVQGDEICLWALVDPETEFCEGKNEPRYVYMLATGQKVSDTTFPFEGFIGTVQTGAFVWHFFMR